MRDATSPTRTGTLTRLAALAVSVLLASTVLLVQQPTARAGGIPTSYRCAEVEALAIPEEGDGTYGVGLPGELLSLRPSVLFIEFVEAPPFDADLSHCVVNPDVEERTVDSLRLELFRGGSPIAWTELESGLEDGPLTNRFPDRVLADTPWVLSDSAMILTADGMDLDVFAFETEGSSGTWFYGWLYLLLDDAVTAGTYSVRATFELAPLLEDVSDGDVEPLVNGGGSDTVVVTSTFTIAGDPEGAAAGPGTTVACDRVAPPVGSTVTCVVSSDPAIDLIWTAGTDATFATGVVTTDGSGAGTFSFVVPAGALGQDVRVQLVEWTAPLSLGIAGGPVPTTVPAGASPLPLLAMALGSTLLGSAVLMRRRRPLGSEAH
jgi:hypothetical protein